MARGWRFGVVFAALLSAAHLAMAACSPTPELAAVPTTVPPAIPTATPTAADSPFPLMATPGYQRVGGPEFGGTFEVPVSGVARRASWRDGAISIQLLLERRPGWRETDFVENHTSLVSQQPVDLGWGTGTKYLLDLHNSVAGGGSYLARLVHVVLRTADGRVCDVRSGAPPDDAAEQRQAD